MRMMLVAVLCLAVGFGAGWAVFEKPWQTSSAQASGQAIDSHDVEVAVLKNGAGEFTDATCNQRKWPTNVWDCTATKDSALDLQYKITAHVNGPRDIEIGTPKLDLGSG